MEEKAIEKAILDREEWESGSLGRSEEFLEFINDEPEKETIFNFIIKVERSSTSLIVSDSLKQKMLERKITPMEVGECLDSRKKQFAIDRRETGAERQTLWFIGKTKKSRELKLVLLIYVNKYILVNVFEPSDHESEIYRHAPAR